MFIVPGPPLFAEVCGAAHHRFVYAGNAGRRWVGCGALGRFELPGAVMTRFRSSALVVSTSYQFIQGVDDPITLVRERLDKLSQLVLGDGKGLQWIQHHRDVINDECRVELGAVDFVEGRLPHQRHNDTAVIPIVNGGLYSYEERCALAGLSTIARFCFSRARKSANSASTTDERLAVTLRARATRSSFKVRLVVRLRALVS